MSPSRYSSSPRPSRRPRWKVGLIILLASFVALVGFGLGLSGSGTSAEAVRPAGGEATVVRIVDGDTLDVRGDGGVLPAGEVVRVRLLAIDAPEKGDCFARAATARLRALLPPGSEVRYERDVDLLDRYDRYLLYLWNERDVFVNGSLVRSGHAEAKLYPPNDARWSEISRAGAAAEKDRSGLWAACPGPASEKPAP